MTKRILFLLMVFLVCVVSAQGTKTVAVRLSSQTQRIGNKEYYVHIVEQGQTVFSIARAYGLKYYDAVIHTDIHLMKVGDTVWLPKNEYSVAAVTANASAVTDNSSRTHYIKVEQGQTLYGLAREYGVLVDDIIDANPELRNSQLQAGQMIKIPPSRSSSASPEQKPAATQPSPAADSKKQDNPVRQEPAVEKVEKDPAADAVRKQQVSQPDETVPAESADKLARKPIVNPYPFAEVPSDFPTAQAPYYNFSTMSTFNYQVRDLHDRSRLFVTVVMPLNLDKINEISTSKFDIEQRGKKEYKVFEFIQFYEGLLMALDQLQQRGVDIVLNVVDLVSDNEEDVDAAFNSHSVANSDFIIALLVKKPFARLAELAKQHQVFVINPFSTRDEVVTDNPYIIKYMPSTEGTVKSILDLVASRHRNANLYIIHSNNKRPNSNERIMYAELQRQLEARKDIKYTFFDWAANSKLVSTLKTTDPNVILSIYDQDQNKNTVFVTTILNRLSLLNTHVPTLISVDNYLTVDKVDFDFLQHLNYTTVALAHLDYNNPVHKSFIDTYKERFRTEPNSLYSGVAHDIMLYFSTALWQQGAEFWRNPAKFQAPAGMLFPLSLKQSSSTGGYENQSPDIYMMRDFKLVKP